MFRQKVKNLRKNGAAPVHWQLLPLSEVLSEGVSSNLTGFQIYYAVFGLYIHINQQVINFFKILMGQQWDYIYSEITINELGADGTDGADSSPENIKMLSLLIHWLCGCDGFACIDIIK